MTRVPEGNNLAQRGSRASTSEGAANAPLILRVTCTSCPFDRTYVLREGDKVVHQHTQMPWGLWRSDGAWTERAS